METQQNDSLQHYSAILDDDLHSEETMGDQLSENESSDAIEHKGVKGMKWKDHIYAAQKLMGNLGGTTIATANAALKKVAQKKIAEKKNAKRKRITKRTTKRSSSKQKKALKRIVTKRKKSKVIKGSGTIKALTDGPIKAKKRATSVTPYKSKFKLTSAMKRRAKYLGFRHSDYINGLVQVDDQSRTLEHHGVQNQKWGVKNGPPYPLERPCSVDRNAGETIPAGTTIYSVSINGSNASDKYMNASYKKEDRLRNRAAAFKNDLDDGVDFDAVEKKYVITEDLKVPSVNERIKMGSKVFDNNKELMAMTFIASDTADGMGDVTYSDSAKDAKIVYQRAKELLSKGDTISDQPDGIYVSIFKDATNHIESIKSDNDKALMVSRACQFYDEAKDAYAKEHIKRGYNCMVDDYACHELDVKGVSRRSADTPLILINPNSTCTLDARNKLTLDQLVEDHATWMNSVDSADSTNGNRMLSMYDIKRLENDSHASTNMRHSYNGQDEGVIKTNTLIQKESLKNAISHSGRKGQKWGVQNGPPYPLDEGGQARYKQQSSDIKDSLIDRNASSVGGNQNGSGEQQSSNSNNQSQPVEKKETPSWISKRKIAGNEVDLDISLPKQMHSVPKRRLSEYELRTMDDAKLNNYIKRMETERKYRIYFDELPEAKKRQEKKEFGNLVKKKAWNFAVLGITVGGKYLVGELLKTNDEARETRELITNALTAAGDILLLDDNNGGKKGNNNGGKKGNNNNNGGKKGKKK